MTKKEKFIYNSLNVIIIVLLIIATIGWFGVGIIAEATPKEENYPLSTVVIEVENDIVMLEDFNGNIWKFEGAEDWEVNDICACIMNNNGTDEIEDDKIIKTRYCGFVK